jgi:hypothetical protein
MSFRSVIGDVALSGTLTATTSSAAIAAPGGAADVLVMVHVTAVAGTGPTMTVTVEQSADGVTGWAAVAGGGTAALSAAGNAVANAAVTQQFIRVVATIGGTTPSFTGRVAVVVFAA